ncbi:MAG: SIMPL domain-containing protein [Acidimicrobiia bacterium]
MKRVPIIVAVAALAVAVSACTPSVTVEAPPADGSPTGISVSGKGEVTGTPDTLTMTFGVSVRRDSVADAVAVAADKADALISALKANGVAEEDIQTANYSVYPQYDWRNETQTLIGYEVNNQVIVKIRDLDTAGAVIDAATAAGGNETTVQGVSFSIEDNDALIEAARQAAWNDAQDKAEQLASLAGVTLGAPTMISETFAPQPQPFAYDSIAFAEAADGATPISPGEQLVAVSLSVQFAIEG